jgi:acyl-CoA thioester hydrolase
MSTRFAFELLIQKRFADFDMFRHVNNTVYPQYVEAARLSYFGEFLKVDLKKYLAFTVNFQIDYVRAASFDDSVCVLMRTKSTGNSSMVLEYEIANADDRNVVYARGEVKQVTCDAVTGKPVRVPDSFRRKIVELEGMPIEEAHLES